MFAYSPDRSMLGAVWVPAGQWLTPTAHQALLADRLACLLRRVEDREDLQEWIAQHLSEAGLDGRWPSVRVSQRAFESALSGTRYQLPACSRRSARCSENTR